MTMKLKEISAEWEETTGEKELHLALTWRVNVPKSITIKGVNALFTVHDFTDLGWSATPEGAIRP
jgi:hypothetical protein